MEKKVLIGLSLLVGVLLVLNLVKGNKSTTQAVKPVPSQQKAQATPPQASPPQPQPIPQAPQDIKPELPLSAIEEKKEEEKLPSPVEEVKPQEKKEEKQDKKEEKKQEVRPKKEQTAQKRPQTRPQSTKSQPNPAKPKEQAPVNLDGYALVCVIGGDCALYKDGQTIKKGSELNGWTVERISPDGIELRKGDQIRKVRLQ